jgi:hypothetical protein
MRHAIDDAIKARWLELAPNSGPWPCDMVAASAIILKQRPRPAAGKDLVQAAVAQDQRGSIHPQQHSNRRHCKT